MIGVTTDNREVEESEHDRHSRTRLKGSCSCPTTAATTTAAPSGTQ